MLRGAIFECSTLTLTHPLSTSSYQNFAPCAADLYQPYLINYLSHSIPYKACQWIVRTAAWNVWYKLVVLIFNLCLLMRCRGTCFQCAGAEVGGAGFQCARVSVPEPENSSTHHSTPLPRYTLIMTAPLVHLFLSFPFPSFQHSQCIFVSVPACSKCGGVFSLSDHADSSIFFINYN